MLVIVVVILVMVTKAIASALVVVVVHAVIDDQIPWLVQLVLQRLYISLFDRVLEQDRGRVFFDFTLLPEELPLV